MQRVASMRIISIFNFQIFKPLNSKLMKNVLATAIVALLLVFASSCSHSNPTPANGYTFKGTSYTPTVIVKSSSSLQASDYSNSSVILVFTTYPTTSGTYKVATGQSPSAANEIGVNFANLNTSTTYHGAPSGTVNATVTVASSGKISVSIPSVNLVSNFSSSDNGAFTANLTEQ